MKKLIYFSIFVILNSINLGILKATQEEESPKTASLLTIPTEIVEEIAQYLYDKDFHIFASSSKVIRGILASSHHFPHLDEKELIQKISNTQIENLNEFIITLGRNKLNLIVPKIIEELQNFQDYDCEIKPENIDQIPKLSSNFKIFMMMKNIVWNFMPNKNESHDKDLDNLHKVSEEKLMTAFLKYNDGQFIWAEEFIRYYGEQLALLSQEGNTTYINALENGNLMGCPLTSNPDEAKRYTKAGKIFKLILPITTAHA